ncbi:MAG: hypothetical protein IKU55_06310, partial [Clostridia bacterium]|nr:hypothetical protein [Clostridia bacterium]
GTLSLGAAVAGLASGAGLGVAMLFRINRDCKRNLLILLYLYAFSATSGVIINLISDFLA